MATYLGETVTSPPTDGVSRVRFSPSASNTLLASSWDGVSLVELLRFARLLGADNPYVARC